MSEKHKKAGRLGGLSGGQVMKERRKDNIKKYDQNPKKCKECNIKIEYDKRRNDFCSHSCGASFNNRMHPKRKLAKNKFCPDCGKKKHAGAVRCNFCNRKRILNNNLKKTLKEKTSNGNARIKYHMVRKIAKIVLELADVPKKCKICGFDICVDVCHIKPISEFSEEFLLSEVNSLDNLIYLCPNHHKMLDKGLISL